MEPLKKLLNLQFNRKLIAILSICALIILLIPVLRLMLYTAPWYDDYNYALTSHNYWLETHSLFYVLKGAVNTVRGMWYAWQGTFSSIFFMALMPALWGEEYYLLGPLFILIMLIVGSWTLAGVTLKRLFRAERIDRLPLQAIVCATLVSLIHTAQGGIYWYNAGVHYVAMHSFFMLLLAGVIALYYVRNKTAIVLLVLWSMLGALLVSGSNYVTSLQGILMLMTVLALWLLNRSRRCFLLLPCLAVYGYGFFKNIIAPGNNVRKTIFEAAGMGMDAIPAIINSFQTGFTRLFTFGGWMMFFVLILALPLFWNLAVKTDFQAKLPGLVSLYSFCFYCTGFTSSFYSMGTEGLGRTLNAVKFTYQLLLLFNELYWICWIVQRKKIRRTCPLWWWFFPLIGGIATFYVLHVTDPAGTFLPYGAYYYVHTGQAYNFHSEYLERVDTIRNGGDVVEVTPYLYRPWFLSSGELSEDYTYEPNESMANWYGKIAIICKWPDEETDTSADTP